MSEPEDLVQEVLKDDSAPSFPQMQIIHLLKLDTNPLAFPQKIGGIEVYGLRKRDLFAMAAMQAMVTEEQSQNLGAVAARAVQAADALLEYLKATE